MAVILCRSFPQGQHHLVDFLHADRICKLVGHLLNALPVIRNIVRAIRPWIQFRRTGKEVMNTPGKLSDFIVSHSPAIFFRKESALRNQNANPFGNLTPVQFHLRIRLSNAAVAEKQSLAGIGAVVVSSVVAAVFPMIGFQVFLAFLWSVCVE